MAGVQIGILDIPSGNPMDITGLGAQLSGFIAAGPEGVQASYSHSVPGAASEYQGLDFGYAAGAGLGVSIMGTYTQSDEVMSYEAAPDWVKNALRDTLTGRWMQ
jgi:hypothetical protein